MKAVKTRWIMGYWQWGMVIMIQGVIRSLWREQILRRVLWIIILSRIAGVRGGVWMDVSLVSNYVSCSINMNIHAY